ncbi:hypothetical protein ABGB17_18155 [Sphaerisporangium sp. B11E5]|uniref:hypothetical protein n=1 Tax=Sphaerisporangium sp. B11E5 TaxID=3153563 RepID=UPI00325C3AE3
MEHGTNSGGTRDSGHHARTSSGKIEKAREKAVPTARQEKPAETARIPFTGISAQRLGVLITAASLTLLTGGILLRMVTRRKRRTPDS